MTDLEKHVSRPGRDKLIKKVREKIDEVGITYIFFNLYLLQEELLVKVYQPLIGKELQKKVFN